MPEQYCLSFGPRGAVKRAAQRARLLLVLAVLVQGCHGCGTRGKPVAEAPSNDVQSRSTMQHFTLANPGIVTFYEAEPFSWRTANYGISAVEPRHLLQTTQFYETGPERDEVRA